MQVLFGVKSGGAVGWDSAQAAAVEEVCVLLGCVRAVECNACLLKYNAHVAAAPGCLWCYLRALDACSDCPLRAALAT
jgi:hypothetical protein